VKARSCDVLVQDEGTIVLVRPVSAAARDWITQNVDPDAFWFGGGLVVEHRYVAPLIEGMSAAGLVLS
jgi:hypothetical protein